MTAREVGIGELAESRLQGNFYLALRNVSCKYHAGVLTLHGCLPTYYFKQIAQEVVAGLAGVEQVINQIEVGPRALSEANRP